MTRHGIERRSPGPLGNTLTIISIDPLKKDNILIFIQLKRAHKKAEENIFRWVKVAMVVVG